MTFQVAAHIGASGSVSDYRVHVWNKTTKTFQTVGGNVNNAAEALHVVTRQTEGMSGVPSSVETMKPFELTTSYLEKVFDNKDIEITATVDGSRSSFIIDWENS